MSKFLEVFNDGYNKALEQIREQPYLKVTMDDIELAEIEYKDVTEL